MKAWKILHSEASLGWGGQEKRILLSMEAERKRGCEVHLVCDPESTILPRASEKRFVVHALRLDPWFHPLTLAKALRLLRQEKFDIVHTHSSADSWALGLAAKSLGLGRPCVVRTRHLSTPVNGTFVYTHLADRIITTGESIRQHLIGKGVQPGKILSIPTGVDLNQFEPACADREGFRREIGADKDTVVIGNVAVLRSWKGHGDFLEAAKKLHASLPNTKFVIAGDGPQREALARRLEAEALFSFVHCTGHREDVPSVLAGLDIFLFTSYANEGVPQAVAQAMAMGKPVVATRVGSIEDLASDGENAILVAPRDIEAMTEAVHRLLRHPALARRLGQAAQARVQSVFSLERMETAQWDFYSALMARSVHGKTPRKLKIALIRQRVSPQGGAEGVVHRLAGELIQRGHDVHVLASDWDVPVPKAVYHRIIAGGTMPWVQSLEFQRSVRKFLKENSFDVVHGFDKTFPVDVYRAGDGSHRAWLKYSMRGMPRSLAFWTTLRPKHWVALWLEKKLLSAPELQKVIANSDLVRRDLIAHHALDPRKIVTIPNGIDPAQCRPPATREERSACKRALGLDEKSTVLLFIGSNYHRKGLRYAMQAVADNCKNGNLVLLVAGKGREKQYRKLSETLRIADRIHFLGAVQDTQSLYRAGDLLVLPTLYDPFSNVCLEAMAHGIPVITTPFNGACEILEEGKSGWVREPEKTSDALTLALAQDLWPLGRNALEQSKKYTFSSMVGKFEDVYLSLAL